MENRRRDKQIKNAQKNVYCAHFSVHALELLWLQLKPMLALCYIRVNMQWVAKDQKYEGNIPIKSTPQHAIAKASTVVRDGFGMTTRSSEGWKYITTTTLR
jgi:hypothetical protein